MSKVNDFERNVALLKANQQAVLDAMEERMRCKVKQSKKDRVRDHLLIARTITGLDFIQRFHITSYRDVIYALRQEGMKISSWDESENGIIHKVWYLGDYDIDFIKYRNK